MIYTELLTNIIVVVTIRALKMPTTCANHYQETQLEKLQSLLEKK
jgi:hypothetical protein